MAVAVGRHENAVGVELVQVPDQVVLAKLGSRSRGESSETADEARRLDRAVVGMGDRAVEAGRCAAGNVVEPFRLEAVLAQCLVLGQGQRHGEAAHGRAALAREVPALVPGQDVLEATGRLVHVRIDPACPG